MLNNPTPYHSGSKTKPNPTLSKSTPAPQQVEKSTRNSGEVKDVEDVTIERSTRVKEGAKTKIHEKLIV